MPADATAVAAVAVSAGGAATGGGDVSVVIVSHNTAGLLRDCLDTVLAEGSGAVAEVVVVDNASTDGTLDLLAERYPAVRVIANDQNAGFGVANNQGVAASRGAFTLLLNSDTLVPPGTIGRLRDTLRANPHVGLLGPRLLNADGSVQASTFRNPTPVVLLLEQASLAPLFPALRYENARPGSDGLVSVDWLKGACLLGRRDELARLGPFDPRFFMFGEDVDLSRRVRKAGLDVCLAPGIAITHLGGGSTRRYAAEMVVRFVESTYLYYRLHYPASALVLALLVFRALAVAKALRDLGRLVWIVMRRLDRDSDARDALTADLKLWARVATLRPPPLPASAPGAPLYPPAGTRR